MKWWYVYFSFDFCEAKDDHAPAENLGQVVFGERIRPSPYKLEFEKNQECEVRNPIEHISWARPLQTKLHFAWQKRCFTYYNFKWKFTTKKVKQIDEVPWKYNV